MGMPDVIDYVTAAGLLSLNEQPFTACDALALAGMCYLDVGSAAQPAEGIPLREVQGAPQPDDEHQTLLKRRRQALLKAMAESVRFGDGRLRCYTSVLEPSMPMQFAAMCLTLGDGTNAVAFRGTDNTLTGWYEDLAMSYESPVPAQDAACEYLQRTAEVLDGPLMLMGHSKGGNLAAYAASHVTPEVQERITAIYSFDGPGLDDATLASAGYAAVRDRLRSYVPQGSVVGLMMGYEENHTVLRSTGRGLGQHDLFTWQIAGMNFETVSRTTVPSQITDHTLHNVLRQCTPAQRRQFVDEVFRLLAATEADTLQEIRQDKLRATARVLAATRDMDGETRRVFLQMLGTFVSSGARGVKAWVDEARPATQEQLKKLLEDMPNLPEWSSAYSRMQEMLTRMGEALNHDREGKDNDDGTGNDAQ